MPSDPSYYHLIGVSADASEHEIRCAYLQKALMYHPDKQQDQQDSGQFLMVQKAWETLRDSSSRQRYDANIRDLKLKSNLSDGRVIFSSVHLNECTPISTDTTRPELIDAYLYECRCGEDYFIDTTAFIDGRQIVPCSSCSFCIEVTE